MGHVGVAFVNRHYLLSTNSHVKTKLMVFRPLISLDSHQFWGCLVNQRSEHHRFGLDVRFGGWGLGFRGLVCGVHGV